MAIFLFVDIRKEHIESKKVIGTLNSRPVHEVTTTGGFHMLVAQKADGTLETLGTGSHRAVARHIARKLHKDLKITEMSKSDELELKFFEHLVPFYTNITIRMNQL